MLVTLPVSFIAPARQPWIDAVLIPIGLASDADNAWWAQPSAHARRCRSVAETPPRHASRRIPRWARSSPTQTAGPGNKIVDYHGAGNKGKHFLRYQCLILDFGC